MQVMTLVVTPLGALLVGAAMVRYRERRDRRRRTLDHAAEVARELRAVLRPLLELVKESRHHRVDAAGVVSLWRTAAQVIDDHCRALPPEWSHLKRSVRAALGEHFGGPSWADLSYGLETTELSSPDPAWQDHALCYLDYVQDRLSVLVASPERLSAGVHLWDFDDWLGATGRHGADRWLAAAGWKEKLRHRLAPAS